MHRIRAIETHYNGYHFRSRSEARFAVFLDTIGLEYSYELEGYDLGPRLGYYLPDFYIPDLDALIEIKGPEPTDVEVSKLKAVCVGTKKDGYIFYGAIEIPKRSSKANLGILYLPDTASVTLVEHQIWTQCPKCKRFFISEYGNFVWCDCIYKQYKVFGNPHSFALVQGYKAAKSARFEHGETPKPKRNWRR